MKEYIPRAGDLGVMQTSGIIGYLIQFGTRSRCNHLVIADGLGGIYEAKPRQGVTHSSLDDYDGIRIAWTKDYKLTAAQRKVIIKSAEIEVGKRYGFAAVLLNILLIFGLHLPQWMTNNLGKEAGFICSEFGVFLWKKAGIVLFPEKADWFVTPADIEFEMLFW